MARKAKAKSKSAYRTKTRRTGRAAIAIALAKRFGKILALLVFVGWLGAWFFLGDADTKTAEWTRQSVLNTTADAGFRVENILVEGRVNTDVDVLKGLINIEKGDPLFSFHPVEAKNLIERISWVRSVRVERRWPDTVYIGLSERRPLALWQHDKKLKLIDEDGAVITDYNLARFEDLIMVTGAEAWKHAPELLALLDAEPEVRSRVESATWIGNRRWDVKMKSGTIVKLPEEDTGFALKRLAVAQAEDGLLDMGTTRIDVREIDRIVVRNGPGKVHEYKAGFRL